MPPVAHATQQHATYGMFCTYCDIVRVMTEKQMHAFLGVLGSEIKVWRKRRGLTRPDLAARVGLSDSTMGRIERGDTLPGLEDTRKIAGELGLKLSELVARAESAADLANGGITITRIEDAEELPPQ